MTHVFVLLAIVTMAWQTPMRPRDAKAIEAAKNVSARDLDSSLPNKSFADWLDSLVGASAKRTWEVNDCGEQTGSPADGGDFPICAEVKVTLPGNRHLFVSLTVGTHQNGVSSRKPELWWAIVVEPDGSKNWLLRKLSEVPAAIEVKPR